MSAGRRGAIASCGCRMGYWNPDSVVAVCAAHNPDTPKPPACPDGGCNKRDAETCWWATWSVQCGCACHPDRQLSSEDVHEFQEDRLIQRDLEDLYERERDR